jgi:hypothetical protein
MFVYYKSHKKRIFCLIGSKFHIKVTKILRIWLKKYCEYPPWWAPRFAVALLPSFWSLKQKRDVKRGQVGQTTKKSEEDILILFQSNRVFHECAIKIKKKDELQSSKCYFLRFHSLTLQCLTLQSTMLQSSTLLSKLTKDPCDYKVRRYKVRHYKVRRYKVRRYKVRCYKVRHYFRT